jgi:hypothetical protein
VLTTGRRRSGKTSGRPRKRLLRMLVKVERWGPTWLFNQQPSITAAARIPW